MIVVEMSFNIDESIASIRRDVFVVEQGISEEDEFEGGEDAFTHFCLFKDGSLVGYIRVAVGRNVLHIGRVAVRREFRNQGLGRVLMDTAEGYGVSSGCISFSLHAQLRARGFYEKLGYMASGEEFVEAGIKHIVMTKDVRRDALR